MLVVEPGVSVGIPISWFHDSEHIGVPYRSRALPNRALSVVGDAPRPSRRRDVVTQPQKLVDFRGGSRCAVGGSCEVVEPGGASVDDSGCCCGEGEAGTAA